jgi:hypothetical protein
VKITFLFTSVIFYKIEVQIIKIFYCKFKTKIKFETALPQYSSELRISKEKINPMPKLSADARRARRAN